MFESGLRKPGGCAIVTAPDGTQTHQDTLTCVHCGNIFVWVKGSGTIRGFCQGCMGFTCGHPSCNEHYPFEKKMDLYEKGKIPSL